MKAHHTPERLLVSAVLDVLHQQKNAKEAAERRYVGALQGCSLTEEFVLSNAATAEPPSADERRYGPPLTWSSAPLKHLLNIN